MLIDYTGQTELTVMIPLALYSLVVLVPAIADGVRSVPDDVAVTGFDGIPLGRLVRPTLTTVRQPMLRMGEEAVELLVRRLNGTPDADPVSLMLPVTVARRASCGCGPEEQAAVAIGA